MLQEQFEGNMSIHNLLSKKVSDVLMAAFLQPDRLGLDDEMNGETLHGSLDQNIIPQRLHERKTVDPRHIMKIGHSRGEGNNLVHNIAIMRHYHLPCSSKSTN